VTESINPS